MKWPLEYLRFLSSSKRWWLLPIGIMILVVLTLLALEDASSPFQYTMF